MASAFKYTTSADLFSSIAGATSEVANATTQLLQAQADSQLNYMSAQYQDNANKFLDELNRKNDYSNWEKDMDDFIEDQRQLFMGQTKTGYASRAVDKMLTNYKVGLKNNIRQRVYESEAKDVLEKNKLAMNLNKKNYSGQTLFDANKAIIDSEYTNGFIDQAQYTAKLTDLAYYSLSKMGREDADAIIELVLNNNDPSIAEHYFNNIEQTLDLRYIPSQYASKAAQEEVKKTTIDGINYHQGQADKIQANADNLKDNIVKDKNGNALTAEEQNKLANAYSGIENEQRAANAVQMDGESKLRGVTLNVDMDVVKKNVKDYYDQMYKIRLNKMQTDNETMIDQKYTDCSNYLIGLEYNGKGSAEEFYTMVKSGADTVAAMGGNKLKTGYQRQMEDQFRNLLSSFNSWLSAQQKANKEKKETITLESIKEIYKGRADNLAQDILNGKISYQDANKMLSAEMKSDFMTGLYKENSDVNKHPYSLEDKQKLWEDRYSNMLSVMLMKSAPIKEYMEKNYPSVAATVNDLLKKMEKDPSFNPTIDGMKNFNEMTQKIIFNMDKDVKEEDVKNELLSMAGACQIDGYYQGRPLFEEQGRFESKKDYMQRIIEDTENNDIVYTPVDEPTILDVDEKGNVKTDSLTGLPLSKPNIKVIGNNEEKLQNTQESLKNHVSEILGVDPEGIKVNYKSAPAVKGAKENNDFTTQMQFTTRDGKKYEFQSVKDENENSKGYNLVEIKSDGTTAVVMNSKEFYSRSAKKERNKTAKEEQKAARSETNAAGNNLDTFIEERSNKERQYYESTTKRPSLIDKKYEWEDAIPVERQYALEKTVDDIDKQMAKVANGKLSAKDFQNKYGISSFTWKNMTMTEKQEYIKTY